MFPGDPGYWGWLATNVNQVALDVKSAQEAETRKKYILIAAGFVGALIFLIVIGKRGK
jgi:hypothetical protein